MLRYGVPVVAAVLLVFGVVMVLQSRPVRPPTVPVQSPPVATYARTVAGVGLVEASSENIAISTPVSGLCTQVYVKVSDRVKTGQKLFSLDDRNLQAELAVRRRALEVAQAQLEKLRRAPRSEEVPWRRPRSPKPSKRSRTLAFSNGSWRASPTAAPCATKIFSAAVSRRKRPTRVCGRRRRILLC